MTKIITPIIEEHLKKQRELKKEERGTKREYFYASDGLLEDKNNSTCPRKLFYEFSDEEPEELDIDTLKNFAVGDVLHEWIQEILVNEKKAEIIEDETIHYNDNGHPLKIKDEKNQIIIKDPVEIHGRMDVQIKEKGEPYIVEIKTIKAGQFFYLKGGPKPGHKLQIQLYMHDKGVKKGILFYINKDTGAFKEFLIEYDKEYVEKALKKFEEVKQMIDSGKIPERPYPIGDWHHNYCPYKKICWAKK